MKYTNKWLMALLPAALLSSCAEDVFEPYQVDKPASIAEQEYLAGYNTLQSYTQLKLSADADFKAYNSKGALYNIVTSNFSEISAAATANHLALVDEKTGIVNSSAIYDLVGGAKAANQSVFGTAILGNTEVNGKYLQKLVADREDPNAKGAPKIWQWTELINNNDCETDDVSSYYSKENMGNPHPSELKPGVGKDNSSCIVLVATAKAEQAWDNQFFIKLAKEVPSGTKFKFSMDIKAATATDVGVATQSHRATPGDYQHWAAVGSPQFSTEWKTYTMEGEVDGAANNFQTIALNLNDFAPANTYYFDNLSYMIYEEIDMPAEYWDNIVDNSDCEGESVVSFFSKESGGNPHPSELKAGEGKGGGSCVVLAATAKVEQAWDNQFFIKLKEPVPAGTKYKFSMDIKASTATEAGVGSQSHRATPGDYQHWAAVGSPKFTTDWQTYTMEGEVVGEANGFQTIAFNLNDFAPANTYYFDNIVYEILKQNSAKIPLTPEEKQANLNGALDKWIGGIFEGADGYINDWILFNGIFDKDGNFKDKEVKADNEFVWQSYYDDPDAYLHGIAKRARDLGAKKLFVSETELNNGGKLSKVIDWIKAFGTDEASTIEGIDAKLGSIEFKDDMSDWKKSYEDMLSGLAASGKLIRISGISIDDKNAKEVAQQKAIGEFYAYIVAKYVELIPSAQQYGVSLPTSGLWKDNARTHQYGSLADGLK